MYVLFYLFVYLLFLSLIKRYFYVIYCKFLIRRFKTINMIFYFILFYNIFPVLYDKSGFNVWISYSVLLLLFFIVRFIHFAYF